MRPPFATKQRPPIWKILDPPLMDTVLTRMHSSRMRTVHSLTVSWEGGGSAWEVSCDLSHHTFDVTCMLSLHQLRLIASAAAYIAFGYVTCDACWDTPSCGQNERHV